MKIRIQNKILVCFFVYLNKKIDRSYHNSMKNYLLENKFQQNFTFLKTNTHFSSSSSFYNIIQPHTNT